MLKNITRATAGVALAGLAVLGLSACTTTSEPKDSDKAVIMEEDINTGGGTESTTVAPMAIGVADLANYEGTEVSVPANNSVNIVNIPDAELGNWVGTSSDENVAVFVPGVAQGANPDAVSTFVAFQTKEAGTTNVTLTNNVTGETFSFVLNVK